MLIRKRRVRRTSCLPTPGHSCLNWLSHPGGTAEDSVCCIHYSIICYTGIVNLAHVDTCINKHGDS